MPIYEYKCQDCGHITEIFVRSVHEKVEILCSHCNSNNLKKIFSTPAAVSVANYSSSGRTCCGRTERCSTPPCSTTGSCRRD
ncbi:MAG: hypothetical protein B5M54_07575 [Candidatus Aminicenantes bacterium 4484_214]|nr:MAG: hypothetical protein B5M54_07575 [Candidatus Aminicenantes bacterium 4484_214]RLE09651.1 MAG: hypothetical protein DRJ06_02510 [Candidatus Aminicenantes bacterium]HDJ23087.1 zinc ribbon domain-containing protein [Candidatus Aminicenantes bacterium]